MKQRVKRRVRGPGREKKALVLLSGGLDSATALYVARRRGYTCACVVFDYGQRHAREIQSARAVARAAGCRIRVVRVAMPWKGSALLDTRQALPRRRAGGIPVTYVPARNIIFLSFALAAAEASGAEAIFIGAHCQDYSGYPDCRPEFISAFQKVALVGTKAGVSGRPIRIEAPLVRMNKARIIRLGASLGVPFEKTWSCYRGGAVACGRCDSCRYRAKGFAEAGLIDRV